MTGTEIETRPHEAPTTPALRAATPGVLPEHSGIIDPDRWAMLAQIAKVTNKTSFVPAALRNNEGEVMACLLFGDAMGFHPSVSLTQVFIVDGKPGLSGASMVGKIRAAGHKVSRIEIRDGNGNVTGITARGERGDTGETDEFTFTLPMAQRAGLMSKHNWKAYPEAMMFWRAASMVARTLFSDVFLFAAVYSAEELGDEETPRDLADPDVFQVYGEDDVLYATLPIDEDALTELLGDDLVIVERDGNRIVVGDKPAEVERVPVSQTQQGQEGVSADPPDASVAANAPPEQPLVTEDGQVTFESMADRKVDQVLLALERTLGPMPAGAALEYLRGYRAHEEGHKKRKSLLAFLEARIDQLKDEIIDRPAETIEPAAVPDRRVDDEGSGEQGGDVVPDPDEDEGIDHIVTPDTDAADSESAAAPDEGEQPPAGAPPAEEPQATPPAAPGGDMVVTAETLGPEQTDSFLAAAHALAETSGDRRPTPNVVVKVRAATVWISENMDAASAAFWQHAAVLEACRNQLKGLGKPGIIDSLEDVDRLDPEFVQSIWSAVPDQAKQAISAMTPAQVYELDAKATEA